MSKFRTVVAGTATLCADRWGDWGIMDADDYRFKLIGGSNIDINNVYVQW